jgi:hypothetical protein
MDQRKINGVVNVMVRGIMDKKQLVTCGCCNETETIEYWLKNDYDPNQWGCAEDFIEWIKSK